MVSEEEIREKLQNFHKAIANRNVSEIMQFFVEDGSLTSNEGTFKGKEKIRGYWKWMRNQFSEVNLEEKDLLIQGNKAAHEYVLKGKASNGKNIELPGIATVKFSNGKMEELHIYHDRLTLAKQAVEGWLGKRTVKSLVGRMEKGLRKS